MYDNEPSYRDALKTAIESVSDVGNVYDYQRRVDTWEAFDDLFVVTINGDKLVRAWMITLDEWEEEQLTFGTSGSVLVTYRYRVIGLVGASDASETEKTMTTLAKNVAKAIKSNTTLQAAALDSEAPTISKVAFSYASFSDVLVCLCEMLIELQEVV